MLQILNNPAFWASLSGLAAAAGFEISDRLIDHILGAIGGIAGIVGLIHGAREGRRRKSDKPQP